ncbi:hypothetical protein KP509_1Z295500 [Ceratopteris richardii]|nr:hypothetical protein KP509_1Z295500 [Ceratopteris richardii]
MWRNMLSHSWELLLEIARFLMLKKTAFPLDY